LFYSSREEAKPILTLRRLCASCGEESKFLLQKQEKSGCIWIIPYWGKDYFITCGNCFKSFKIDNETGEAWEKGLGQIQKQVSDTYSRKVNIELDLDSTQNKEADNNKN